MKTYFTFLERNKLFTFVNVAGLSISLMFVLLIANMVTRQLTVEKDQRDADRIFVFTHGKFANAHYLIGEKLQNRYPEVEDWCSYTPGFTQYTLVDEKPVNIKLLTTRKNFFEFFSYKLIEGNPEQVLLSNTSIVLTRSCANMLFGGQPALGKTLRFPELNDQIFTVTGIMEDFNNAIIPDDIQAVIPYENTEYINYSISIKDNRMSNATSAMVFIRSPKDVDPNDKAEDVSAYLKEIWWFGGKPVHFLPFRDFYFATNLDCNIPMEQYDITMVWIILTAGVLILLMAVFNYISMSVAQTSYRAKEMATRRLLGSSRPDIFWRMIAESALLTFTAFLIGFLLAKAAEPIAMDLLRVKLDLIGDLTIGTLLIYIAFILLLSYLSGFIPATILSNYSPLDVVKGTFRRKTKTIYLRTLNIVQNGLAIAMLTCALFLSVQIYRILHEPLGYTYGNILALTPAAENETLLAFRNEALKLPFVKRICFTQGTPRDGGNNNTLNVPIQGSTKSMSFQCFIADSSFIDMFGDPVTNPNNYQFVCLGDLTTEICDIGSNGSNAVVAKNLKMSDTEDYAYMIRAVNFSDNNIFENMKYVSKEVYDFFRKSQIFGNEIIMCKIGSAGKFWLMPKLNKPTSLGLNSFLMRFNDNTNRIFIYHYLNTSYGQIEINTRVSGAVTKSITKGAIRTIPVYLPDIEQQNQFAKIVQKVEAQKEKNQEIIEQMNNLFNSLMQQAFKGEL